MDLTSTDWLILFVRIAEYRFILKREEQMSASDST